MHICLLLYYYSGHMYEMYDIPFGVPFNSFRQPPPLPPPNPHHAVEKNRSCCLDRE
jgi:hypothetical protein